ncbi:hypothetical protein KGP36_06930 [Patescibacteria group bacterium]|nr:hypothetical protein [Patescibacteria group bacterium]
MRSDEPPPEECPLCQQIAMMQAQVSAPHIGRPIGRVGDQTYRQLEESSYARAEIAANLAGVDVSEMSSLKITDFNDRTIPGEVGAKRGVNIVENVMDSAGMNGFSQNQEDIKSFIAGGNTGEYAHSARPVVQNITTQHKNIEASVKARGRKI